MVNVTIRNLEADLEAKLRVVAASHGRSMEEEILVILAQALSGSEKRGGLGSRIHARFASISELNIEPPVNKSKARAADFDE
ncbi:Arc family DNA-binding protein [Pseudomonas sp. JH-2]|uniref:FitA-like ribbon-helix-helix domain-containing protein n=1 Tax=Pseudomonas sp. JH-2 TaxID=3114998 RepID=UPI002E25DAF3|nr:Arc family DNA-binding protein [Pseudomonas sp. JH-2]